MQSSPVFPRVVVFFTLVPRRQTSQTKKLWHALPRTIKASHQMLLHLPKKIFTDAFEVRRLVASEIRWLFLAINVSKPAAARLKAHQNDAFVQTVDWQDCVQASPGHLQRRLGPSNRVILVDPNPMA